MELKTLNIGRLFKINSAEEFLQADIPVSL